MLCDYNGQQETLVKLQQTMDVRIYHMSCWWNE